MKLPSQLLLLVIVSSSVLIGQSRAQGPIAPIRGWFSNIMSSLGRAAGLVTTVTVYDTTTMTTTVTVTATGQQGILGADALLEVTTLSDDLLDSTISSVSDSTAGQDAVDPDSSPVIISITTSSAATPFRNTTFATTIPKTTTVKSTSVTKAAASVSKTTSSVVKTTAPKTSSSSTKSSVAKTTTSSLILAVRQGSRFFASLRKPKDEESEDLAAEDSDIVLSPSKVLTLEHSAAAQMPYVIKRSVDIESSLMASNQHRKSVLASYSATD